MTGYRKREYAELKKPYGPKNYDHVFSHPEFQDLNDHHMTKGDEAAIRNMFQQYMRKYVINEITDAEQKNNKINLNDSINKAFQKMDSYLLENYPECVLSEFEIERIRDEDVGGEMVNIKLVLDMYEVINGNIKPYKKTSLT